MYVYKITNKINKKTYIGITNNYTRRWAEHCNATSVIGKAIQKYGKDNFDFIVLLKGLSIEEASEQEKKLILDYNSLVPNGYNVAKGGTDGIHFGENGFTACLTDDEAQYIKDNRHLPMYVLYNEFSEKITYDAFKRCYKHQTYTHLTPHAEEYPYNFEFSCQFNNNFLLDYDDIVFLREEYQKGTYWKILYEHYKDIYPNPWVFWNVYNGNQYKLVMPEVFSNENKRKHSSLKAQGENNSHAKLSEQDVRRIRQMHSEGSTNKELYDLYPQVSASTIRNVINFKTWKNVL